MNTWKSTAVIILSTITFTLGVKTPAASAADGDVVTVRVPDEGIQPQARIDQRGRIHLIFFKGSAKAPHAQAQVDHHAAGGAKHHGAHGHQGPETGATAGDVYYTRSDDGAKTFATPIRVNSQPNSAIAIGTIRGPHLAVGKGGRVHVAWMGSKVAEPKAGGKHVPMLYARMNDAGDGFESQRNVIRQRAGLDGGGSVAADAEGNVYVAWHAPENPREHEEEKRHVWVVRSGDDGRTFDEETTANPTPTGVCGCCGMRVFADQSGSVLALYRSATAMVNRDMFLLTSRDKGQSFTAKKVGPWRVGRCVMSTASLVEGPRGALLAAWEQEEQVYTARLDRTTLNPSDPQPLSGTGKNPKHPVAAFDADGRFVVAWTEGTGWNKGGDVAWQVFDPQGRPVTGSKGRVTGLPTWSVPAVVPGPGEQFIIIY